MGHRDIEAPPNAVADSMEMTRTNPLGLDNTSSQAILLLTPGALAADPRACRAAVAAVDLGWDVVVASVDSPRASRPNEPKMIYVHPGRATSALHSIGIAGGRTKHRSLLRELRGVFRLLRFALLTRRLVRGTKDTGPFGIVHANDLETLPAAALLARRWGGRLVYDAHEIYAAQEPDPPRLYRFVSKAIEAHLARRADAITTVSTNIADELKQSLRLARAPTVVLNCPEMTTLKDSMQAPSHPLRVVYQGSVGPGRDVADIFAAATAVSDVMITIRLAGTAADALRREVDRQELGDRVWVAEPVDPAGDPSALVRALVDFDVGIIINRPVTRNDELVMPNKLFEYLMAGLAVVAPRLPGLAALIDDEAVGRTFEPGNPSSLALVLDELAAHPAEVAAMKHRAREAASARYNAQAQRPALYRAWGV